MESPLGKNHARSVSLPPLPAPTKHPRSLITLLVPHPGHLTMLASAQQGFCGVVQHECPLPLTSLLEISYPLHPPPTLLLGGNPTCPGWGWIPSDRSPLPQTPPPPIIHHPVLHACHEPLLYPSGQESTSACHRCLWLLQVVSSPWEHVLANTCLHTLHSVYFYSCQCRWETLSVSDLSPAPGGSQ